MLNNWSLISLLNKLSVSNHIFLLFITFADVPDDKALNPNRKLKSSSFQTTSNRPKRIPKKQQKYSIEQTILFWQYQQRLNQRNNTMVCGIIFKHSTNKFIEFCVKISVYRQSKFESIESKNVWEVGIVRKVLFLTFSKNLKLLLLILQCLTWVRLQNVIADFHSNLVCH